METQIEQLNSSNFMGGFLVHPSKHAMNTEDSWDIQGWSLDACGTIKKSSVEASHFFLNFL